MKSLSGFGNSTDEPMRQINIHPTHALLAFALICGCQDKQVSLDETTETALGAQGGPAVSAAGELTVTFQSGTLSQDSVITIRTDRAASEFTLESPIYDLTVSPAVSTFDPPVDVSLKVESSAENLTLVNLDTGTPVVVEGAVYDAQSKTLTASLTHFSRYAAMTVAPSDCPTTAPTSGSCTTEGLRCEYGQECCCGQCHPAQVSMCNGGQWGSFFTDACLAGPSACPDAGTMDMGNPDQGSTDGSTGVCPSEFPSGSCSDEGLRCEYGQECCCGECFPSLVATCSGGSWAGMNTDACFRPGCPDAG